MDNYIHLTAFENIQTRSETQLLVHRIAHAQLHRRNQVTEYKRCRLIAYSIQKIVVIFA